MLKIHWTNDRLISIWYVVHDILRILRTQMKTAIIYSPSSHFKTCKIFFSSVSLINVLALLPFFGKAWGWINDESFNLWQNYSFKWKKWETLGIHPIKYSRKKSQYRFEVNQHQLKNQFSLFFPEYKGRLDICSWWDDEGQMSLICFFRKHNI